VSLYVSLTVSVVVEGLMRFLLWWSSCEVGGECSGMDDELLLRRLAKLDAVVSALLVEVEQIRLVLAEVERSLSYGSLRRVPSPD
jgi:hypothetical protein